MQTLLGPSTRRRIRRVGVAVHLPTACVLLIGLLQAAPAAAQEIRWRLDYNAARKEASDHDVPLLLEFGTENCTWCRRLEMTTFRNETIVGLLNERFIPLKIDGDRQQALTEALHIHSYPTLVLAGADGKIIGTLEGYLEADRLQEQLNRVLAVVANPDWMTQDYQEALKALKAGDQGRAVALLKSIVEDGKERAVQVKARLALKEMEQEAEKAASPGSPE